MGEGNERRWVGKKGKMRVKMEGREEEMKQRERERGLGDGGKAGRKGNKMRWVGRRGRKRKKVEKGRYKAGKKGKE